MGVGAEGREAFMVTFFSLRNVRTYAAGLFLLFNFSNM